MAGATTVRTKAEDYVAQAVHAPIVEQTTSNALTVLEMRCEGDNTQGRNQQNEQPAETPDVCDTGADTYQKITRVEAHKQSSALVGFINAQPGVYWQEVDGIYTDGKGSFATAGVVNSLDSQEPQQTPPARQVKQIQKISGVRATSGSIVGAGYINAKEQDYRDRQEIQGVSADQESVALAGVARNVALQRGSVIEDFRNDTRLQNRVKDAENLGQEP